MLLHTVKVYPSKINLPKKKQLAWKIAEIASDNAKLNKDAIEMVINRIIDNASYKGIIETDSICGCCSIYRSGALKLSGLGDEEFFFGPEDMDLSFRLKKLGKLIVILDLKSIHNIVSSAKVSGWLSRSY